MTVSGANGLLARAYDPDGDRILVSTNLVASSILNQPGGVVLRSDGSFDFYPFPAATGTAVFRFEVKDSFGLSTLSELAVTVIANQAPVVPQSRYTTSRQSKLTVNAAQGLLAGATDPEGDSLRVVMPTVPLVKVGQVGAFTIYPDGSFTFHPNPASTWFSESLVFEVEDSFGKRTTSSVSVTISP